MLEVKRKNFTKLVLNKIDFGTTLNFLLILRILCNYNEDTYLYKNMLVHFILKSCKHGLYLPTSI